MNEKQTQMLLGIIAVVLIGAGLWWFRSINSIPESSRQNPESSEETGDAAQGATEQPLVPYGEAIEVIMYNDVYLPVSALRVGEAHPPHATGPGCPEQHWHADAPVTAVNDQTIHPDPLPGGCGFGTLLGHPIYNYDPNLGEY